MKNSQWNLPLVSKPEFQMEKILRTHADHLHTYAYTFSTMEYTFFTL